MENLLSYSKYIVAALGTICTSMFGSWDMALRILILFMFVDYITGLIKGKIENNLKSQIGFNGILRKSTILLVLIVAVSLDKLINSGNWIFRTLVAYFYIGNEGLSILENISVIGVPLPEGLKNALAQLKENKEQEKSCLFLYINKN